MNVPRIVIAGAQSGVGKTTISIGLMSALRDAGYRVQGFKVGPDYIDPSYHNVVTGRLSENLDVWMVPPDQIVEVFLHATKDADIAVIEGVMGLYDGVSGLDETGSTAQIAKILKCPVILVLEVHNMARTAAAVALGYKNFDKGVNIAGIILNNVAGKTHADWCQEAIETVTGIPVIGSLPVNKEIELPERHLGLIPTAEKETFNSFFPKIKDFIRININFDAIIKMAKSAGEMPRVRSPVYPARNHKRNVVIGVSFDEAFNFYYPSNLSLFEAYGAEIVRFSPIHDRTLPVDVDGLYIGGGFPEMLPKELEANQSMRDALKKAAEDGLPIYAECAGLMYLTESITNFDGNSHKMVGLLKGKTVMTRKTLVTYSLAEVTRDNFLCKKGSQLKGHEFHNSKIIDIPADAQFAYAMKMGEGIIDKKDAWLQYNVLASYMHIHFAQNPQIVRNFLKNCKKHPR
jgi:cobyrinic acid a,c-diamide synthase